MNSVDFDGESNHSRSRVVGRTTQAFETRFNSRGIEKTLNYYRDTNLRKVTRKVQPDVKRWTQQRYVWPFWLLECSRQKRLGLTIKVAFQSLCAWSIAHPNVYNDRWIRRILKIFHAFSNASNEGYDRNGQLGKNSQHLDSPLAYAIRTGAVQVARVYIICAKDFGIDLNVPIFQDTSMHSSPIDYTTVLDLIGRYCQGQLFRYALPRVSANTIARYCHVYLYHGLSMLSVDAFAQRSKIQSIQFFMSYVVECRGEVDILNCAWRSTARHLINVIEYYVELLREQRKWPYTEAYHIIYDTLLKVYTDRERIQFRALEATHCVFYATGPKELVMNYVKEWSPTREQQVTYALVRAFRQQQS